MSILDKFPYEKMEEGRFLELDGSPVPKYKSKGALTSIWRGVSGQFETPEVYLSLLVLIGVSVLTPETQNGVDLLGNFIFAGVMSKGYTSITLGKEKNSENLYFDKSPAKVNSKIKNYSLAKAMRGYSAFMAMGMVGCGGLFNYAAGGLNESMTVLATTAGLVHGFNAYRFNKVLKNEWQITDTIPQQEEKETKTNLSLSPSF